MRNTVVIGIWCMVFGICTHAYALNLDSVKASLLQEDYKQAITEGEKLIAQYNHSPGVDELYYILGLSYLKDGNYLRASDIFEIILKEFKNSKFREEAKLGLADTFFLRNDFDKAQDLYLNLLKESPATPLKPMIYHRLSQAAFKSGSMEQGKNYADKLSLEYPLNLESKTDKEVCPLPQGESGFYYTVQVGSFSKSVNANNLVKKLLQKGYPAYMEQAAVSGGASYRVRVGRTRSRQDAAVLERKLSQEGYPTRICP
jgi:tetratricopeptide (TPR) repeat protein